MKRRSKGALTSASVLVLLTLGGAQAAWATEAVASRSAGEKVATIGTSLVTPFFGAYYLEGKVRASRSYAVVMNGSYLTIENGAWRNRAGTVGVGLEYFFQGEALRRWYVEAIGEVWLVSPRHEPTGGVAPMGLGYAAIALLGYQFVFDRGLVLDLGAGVVGFHLPGAQIEGAGGPASSEAVTKIYPAVKVNVGWGF